MYVPWDHRTFGREYFQVLEINNGPNGRSLSLPGSFPCSGKLSIRKFFSKSWQYFPWEPYRLTVEVMNIVYPELEAKGVVGSMPTFFWGEMYANFGSLGILVPPFFIGYVVYMINILIFCLPMSPVVLAVFLSVTMYIKNLSGTGLSAYLIDLYGSSLLVFTLLFLSISGRGIVRYRSSRIMKQI